MLFRSITWDPIKTVAINQYNTVGFHLINVSSWDISVAPPKMTITAKLIHIILSTWRLRNQSQAICAIAATIATAVAMKISYSLNATKNKITGNRSKRNFIAVNVVNFFNGSSGNRSSIARNVSYSNTGGKWGVRLFFSCVAIPNRA